MTKHANYCTNPSLWLDHIAAKRGIEDHAILQKAIDFYRKNTNTTAILLEKGLDMADALLKLGLDSEALTAALLYPAFEANLIQPENITSLISERVSKLLSNVSQVQALSHLRQIRGHEQIEKSRRLLLAMIGDVRSLLIVFAERIWQLHQAKNLDKNKQKIFAQETIDL
jgi:GTP pyrophosphokinase